MLVCFLPVWQILLDWNTLVLQLIGLWASAVLLQQLTIYPSRTSIEAPDYFKTQLLVINTDNNYKRVDELNSAWTVLFNLSTQKTGH